MKAFEIHYEGGPGGERGRCVVQAAELPDSRLAAALLYRQLYKRDAAVNLDGNPPATAARLLEARGIRIVEVKPLP